MATWFRLMNTSNLRTIVLPEMCSSHTAGATLLVTQDLEHYASTLHHRSSRRSDLDEEFNAIEVEGDQDPEPHAHHILHEHIRVRLVLDVVAIVSTHPRNSESAKQCTQTKDNTLVSCCCKEGIYIYQITFIV